MRGSRLDPRTKLYLLILSNLLLFLHVDLETELIMTALFLIPFFFSGKVKSGLKFAGIYAALLYLSYQWLLPFENTFTVLIAATASSLRMMLAAVITGSYAFTTTTMGEFVSTLRYMQLSEKIIVPFVVMVRFFPTIIDDYTQIRRALAFRGINLSNPLKHIEYVLIPLLMNANKVAEDLAVSAVTKGINCPGRHTSMAALKMHVRDVAWMLITAAPYALYLGGVI